MVIDLDQWQEDFWAKLTGKECPRKRERASRPKTDEQKTRQLLYSRKYEARSEIKEKRRLRDAALSASPEGREKKRIRNMKRRRRSNSEETRACKRRLPGNMGRREYARRPEVRVRRQQYENLPEIKAVRRAYRTRTKEKQRIYTRQARIRRAQIKTLSILSNIGEEL